MDGGGAGDWVNSCSPGWQKPSVRYQLVSLYSNIEGEGGGGGEQMEEKLTYHIDIYDWRLTGSKPVLFCYENVTWTLLSNDHMDLITFTSILKGTVLKKCASYTLCWRVVKTRCRLHSEALRFEVPNVRQKLVNFRPRWWHLMTLLEPHRQLCRPRVSPKDRRKREQGIQGQGKWKAFGEGRRERGEKRKRNKEAVCKLQKPCDSYCRQLWPLYRCFCSPLTPLHFPHFSFAWCLWWSSVRGAGVYQSHCCLLQTSKPAAPVHPSAPIIISARPRWKASYTGGEIFDLSSLQGSTVTQTTGRRSGGGGGGKGSGRAGVGAVRGMGKWERGS